jgi:NADPH:quinone reductase-like Zn-dependent oxidoreductase
VWRDAQTAAWRCCILFNASKDDLEHALLPASDGFRQSDAATLGGIVEAVEQGKLAPTIGRTVPLSEAVPAIIEFEKTGLPPGKLVVILK